MNSDYSMAVCRRTRVVKLTVFVLLTVGLLYIIFPEELTQFLAEFAPPKVEKSVEKTTEVKAMQKSVVMNQRRKHSESETYLTPGNPGNFEPPRDEEGDGPGEKGLAHNTKPGQADKVDQSITEYGNGVFKF